MQSLTEEIKASLRLCVRAAEMHEQPYRHWYVNSVFPQDVYATLKDMPFPVAHLGGVSGTREAHNAVRVYFSGRNLEDYDDCRATANAFQDEETVRLFTDVFGSRLTDTFVRIEYAQDTNGFWLRPHTDIGVKMFTMLIYMSNDPRHADLGTDIYSDEHTLVARSPFRPNSAMIFVPSDRSWHGFEKRPIPGVRRSLIVNYVTNEWRAREQLAFPQEPVLA
jgi:hypothetical protein